MNNWDMIRHLQAEGFTVLMPRIHGNAVEFSYEAPEWDLTEFGPGVEIIKVPDELKYDEMYRQFVTIGDKEGFVVKVHYSPLGELRYVLLDTVAKEDKAN